MSDVLTRLAAALETRYRVSKEIGAGGMATVYLAHDLRHERDVAIKVLHPELAAALGAERFLTEIKTTAKLQHPHILPLLDSGDANGLLYYVMPYVAGESLRSRLTRETQLAVDDAVRIAREVAAALESAHRQGVVHRDIKPENILLHEDQALVADFGIALAVSAAGGPRMTQTGLSLGTPAYMAPEQAMGERTIDGRADIYALGAVLYEMLVGEAPFTGPSVQAIVARVMTEQPRPVTGQRRSVPEHVNAAVLKALQKVPADRFTSAAQMSAALVAPDSMGLAATTRERHPGGESRQGRRWLDLLPWSIAAIALVLAGISLVRRAATAGDQPLMHLAISVPPEIEVVTNDNGGISITADGLKLAFSIARGGTRGLAIRDLALDTLLLVQGSSASNGPVEFSPDGQWLAFSTNENLYKVRVAGGPPVALANARWAHVAWAGNESLVHSRTYNTGLFRVSSEGRDTATLTTPDPSKGELGHWWPQVLPDGEHVLFTNFTTPADKSVIEVVSLKNGTRKVVFEGGYHARYASGRLLFVRGTSVMTVLFDIDGLRSRGSPVPLPLSIGIYPTNGWAGFAVSTTGVLAYISDPRAPVELTLSDEGGIQEPAGTEAGAFLEAVVSPDGRLIAAIRDGDVWVFDRSRRFFTRLTRTEQVEGSIVWTPDSRFVLYRRDVPQFDIFRRAADGSTPEDRVMTSVKDKNPTSISPDGRYLLYDAELDATHNGVALGNDIGIARLDAASAIDSGTFTSIPANQTEAKFSPDGMWIAYQSDESSRSEIYMAPYPASRGTARQQVSISGGLNPQWGPDGRTVYYEWGGRIIRARVNPRTGEIGAPEPLTRLPSYTFWSIGPNGRFLLGTTAANAPKPTVKVVMNWPALIEDSR
ncbi:MAG: protein kinase domain-containing protein [Gemmatimonadaceae bacterium]